MSEGRAATGYDHGYDAEVLYLGLALDPAYVEGFVEGALERIDEDDDGEDVLRGVWEGGDDRDFALETLKGWRFGRADLRGSYPSR